VLKEGNAFLALFDFTTDSSDGLSPLYYAVEVLWRSRVTDLFILKHGQHSQFVYAVNLSWSVPGPAYIST
jgi:hypothetical protein